MTALRYDVNDVNIAKLLNLSPKTVGHHTTHVINKLAISDNTGLMRLAIRMGIIIP